MRQNILIIEDDKDISEILRFALMKEGYKVKINPNGLEAEDEIKGFNPDLILLDILLISSLSLSATLILAITSLISKGFVI